MSGMTNEQRAEAAAKEIVWGVDMEDCSSATAESSAIIARHYADVFKELKRLRDSNERLEIFRQQTRMAEEECRLLRCRLAKLVEAVQFRFGCDHCDTKLPPDPILCEKCAGKVGKAIAEATK